MAATHPILSVPGFDLPYRIEGEGRPTLIIGDTVYYPRTFSPDLRQHLRLIFMAHRGFGNATGTFTTADFELDILAEDIERLRLHLGLEKMIVVGHSGHGHIALTYAKKYPQHVSHLVIMAMSPDSSPASFQTADQYLADSVAPERKALFAENMAHLAADIEADPARRFIHYSLRSGARIWFDPTYDARPLWEGVQVIPEMFDYVWGTLFQTIDIQAGIDRLTMPVLLVLGRYDYWNPPHLWEGVRGAFPDLTVKIFERSGHTPQLEQAEAFNQELLGWLQKG